MEKIAHSSPIITVFPPPVNNRQRINQLENEVVRLRRQLKALEHENRRLQNKAPSPIGLPCSLTFIENLANHLPKCIVHAFDQNLRFFFAGGEGLDLINVTPSYYVGHTLRELEPVDSPAPDLFEPIYRATLQGHFREFEYQSPRNHVYQGVVFPLIDATGDVVAGLVISRENVTQKQAEKERMAVAVFDERQRIAQELHDVVSQTLFTVNMIADVLPKLWERSPEVACEKLKLMRHNTQLAFTQMRTLLYELRPQSLKEVILPELIKQLVTTMTSRTEMSIELKIECKDEWLELPHPVKIALYRIVQEGMNNAIQHARASLFLIQIRCEPLLGRIVLTLKDDGQGFDPGGNFLGHLGLKIMRDRAEQAGITISIRSEIGSGTEINALWEECDLASYR